MKITVLAGSPHRNGTTSVLVKAFTEGAEEAGNEVTCLNLASMNIHPCLGCDHCRQHGGVCVHRDNMNVVREAVSQADLVAFVTPLYYFGMSAQLKTAIDRFYAFNEELRSSAKKACMLAACPVDKEGAEALKPVYHAFCQYLKWEDAGAVYAADCAVPEEIEKSRYPEEARNLGRSIG